MRGKPAAAAGALKGSSGCEGLGLLARAGEVQNTHLGKALVVPVKSKGHKSDGLFRVSVDMGFEGARKALQSLTTPGLPRGAGPAKVLCQHPGFALAAPRTCTEVN